MGLLYLILCEYIKKHNLWLQQCVTSYVIRKARFRGVSNKRAEERGLLSWEVVQSAVSSVSEKKRNAFKNTFSRSRVEKCGQMTSMAKLISYTFTTSRFLTRKRK
jgi:hypothetical protein